MNVGLALLLPLALVIPVPAPARPVAEESALDFALKTAEKALENKDEASSFLWIERALERDPKSVRAWDLRSRYFDSITNYDGRVYSLHQALRLAIAQKLPKATTEELRTRLYAVDPIAPDMFGLSKIFVAKLEALAAQYEADGRPHSAIHVHKEILALDPESPSSAAIQRLASKPDPSLAGDAKPKDLLEGVSAEWIRDYDAQHATWKDHGKLEREHYVTHTNSGYANLVRAAEAMEQMNAFYREFFGYGSEGDSRSVPRIDLMIFNTRDEYLKLGSSPAEWSGGQFTGSTVETYVGDGGFDNMVGTLFHEAAHQFVSLATNASGWLNEGLASFFEGCRILSNGTVIMNLPANHRLFPMVERMQAGWMADAEDGIDPKAASKSNPTKAPTFRIVLENKYEWGPPWYAPTWAVVYFLYNYQDPIDGRYVYRAAFRTFLDASGGRVGTGAVRNFEEVVLANPSPPIKGVPRPKGAQEVKLPKTIDELNDVWSEWLTELAKIQKGEVEVVRPWAQWARYAVKNKDDAVAREHFEKALISDSQDVEAMLDFAAFLADRNGTDRATKLALQAIRILESRTPIDPKAVQTAERSLEKWDPKRKALDTVHHELWAAGLSVVQRYKAAGVPTMVMDLAWHFGTDLNAPGMMVHYADAVRQGGMPLQRWQLAYNERDLDGWNASADEIFTPDGENLVAKLGEFTQTGFDYRVMTLDTTTSGDYSFEAEVLAEKGQVNFCGLVFGKKDINNFHGLILFPGKVDTDGSRTGLADSGFIDLASCFDGTNIKTWRHSPVKTTVESAGASAGQVWHKLRIDVSGSLVDSWFDGEFVATQDFGNVDVLRGSFGVIVGPGTATFTNLRYLARPLNDPAAKIDREIRFEKQQETTGGPVGGSYIGLVPPFPEVQRWIQDKRTDWTEKGPRPQMLVFWSIPQNNLVPIDEWLGEFVAKYARIGLECIAIGSVNDADEVEKYLAEHPLPGAIAIDRRDKPGIGNTFEEYFIDKFNLPRILLLDVDGRVVWEGDPGFSSAEPWEPNSETFLDAPLVELVTRGRLEELADWLTKWKERGAAALKSGDVATALPLMRAAREFPVGRTAEIDDARNKLDALEATIGSLQTAAAAFARDGADPAIPVLAGYAPLLKQPIDKNTQVVLAQYRDARISREWTEAAKACDKIRVNVKKDVKLTLARELLAKLEQQQGRFSKELAADLAPAVEAGDIDALQKIATEAPRRPAQWLFEVYFRW
jgi:Tfp pilus assembly protein PilF